VNNARATAIEAQGTIYVENLQPGSYQVRLAGMAADCSTRPGRNPITVTVVPADTVNVAFEVICDTPPGGGTPLP
jgi:hypothetical protein